jgi:hypothetical protein
LATSKGIDSERGIALRSADSLALRDFLGVGLESTPPDSGLVKGKTLGIDATTLEANAELRSIVRRDTCEGYEEFGARAERECVRRAVRSIKEECLDRMIPVGERQFRRAIAEFVEHYHRERNTRVSTMS